MILFYSLLSCAFEVNENPQRCETLTRVFKTEESSGGAQGTPLVPATQEAEAGGLGV